MIHRWARSERGLSIVGGLHHSSVVVEPEGHVTSTVPGRRGAALSPEGGDGCVVVALVGAGQPASFAACPVTSSPGGCRTRPPLGGPAFTPFPRCAPPRTTASQTALGRGVFPALEDATSRARVRPLRTGRTPCPCAGTSARTGAGTSTATIGTTAATTRCGAEDGRPSTVSGAGVTATRPRGDRPALVPTQTGCLICTACLRPRPVAPFPDTCAPVDVERGRALVAAHASIAATPPYTRGFTRSLGGVLRNGCGIGAAGRCGHPGGPGCDVRSPAAAPVLGFHVSDWRQNVCTAAEGLALRCVTDHSRSEGVRVDRG